MPKEIINYPSYTDPAHLAVAVSVHWSELSGLREEGPQISFQFNVDEMYDWLTKLRQGSPTDKRIPVHTEPLTRAETQRLIRAAKRARNAAFGADE